MDQFVVDLGPSVPGCARGTARSCSARVPAGEPTALEWAEQAGTIDYEILTAIRGRRVRRYVM